MYKLNRELKSGGIIYEENTSNDKNRNRENNRTYFLIAL